MNLGGTITLVDINGLPISGTNPLAVSATVTATNPSVAATGGAQPGSATYIGWNNAGVFLGVSAANPLPISGSISATNPSVSATGAAVPASATYAGFNSGGNLTGISAGNPLPVTGTVTASNPSIGTNSAAAPSSSTQIGGVNAGNLLPLLLDASGRAIVNINTLPAISGTVTANAGTNLNTSALALESGNLATIAGAVSGARFQDNIAQFGGAPIVTGTGASGAGIPRVTVSNDSSVLNTPQVASTGGSIPYHNLTAASANFTNVKGAAAQMYSFRLGNTSGAAIFVKFYDKATAPGTGDTPKDTLQVPPNGTVIAAFPEGMKFLLGFGWAATGGVADNDNTAIAANCIVDFSLNS